jgi:prevent-host-death family protein
MNKNKEVYISASEFKKHCASLIDQVNKEHNSLVITKRNIPIARLVSVDNSVIDNTERCFGIMKGSLTIKKDIGNYSSESDWEINNE